MSDFRMKWVLNALVHQSHIIRSGGTMANKKPAAKSGKTKKPAIKSSRQMKESKGAKKEPKKPDVA
ncbi:hypothetical protein [Nonomuraea sp. NEAU-A123]|uniref:hypothetical protein n=1 Tax=Nonomuraea sp. NEAU-A123 TaxID=2839649 RepID=UPI001BE4A75C|nr:hypothetical protein [Nonomuraea sp. NEAU-A123]MBT2227549.1 hypothetical protein [Nonomuraea sp. NEAU-A123]